MEAFRKDLFSSLHAMMPGTVLRFDSASGLADVQPCLRRQLPSGAVLTAPVLSGVPVLLPFADHAVSPGDPCLLLFCDFCLDGWLETGQPVVPPSPRRHDLSDAIALAGYMPAVRQAPDSASAGT